MTSAVERHSILIGEGWTTRADGLLRPPPDWCDRRVYSRAAAWEVHLAVRDGDL